MGVRVFLGALTKPARRAGLVFLGPVAFPPEPRPPAISIAPIAEAVGHALTENEPVIERIIAEADDPLAAFADWYVSAAHRDDPASGCGVVALGADVQRAGGRAQEAYRRQVERYLAHLQTLIGGNEPENRRQAMVTLSAMVGAVMIGRALGPNTRSDELLQAVREAVRERQLLPE